MCLLGQILQDKFLFVCLFPQTLLHEMIHALLFVTQNNRDRDGHGPEFCKHMNRINKSSGTNISVGLSSLSQFKYLALIVFACLRDCNNRNNPLKRLRLLVRSTTVSTMRLMCTGSTGGNATGPARTASPTLALWRGPWIGLHLLWTPGGRTTRGRVEGRTPKSRSLKDMAKKAKRMGRPQRQRPQEIESLQVQLQVISLFLCCMFCCNSYIYIIVHFLKHCKLFAVKWKKHTGCHANTLNLSCYFVLIIIMWLGHNPRTFFLLTRLVSRSQKYDKK